MFTIRTKLRFLVVGILAFFTLAVIISVIYLSDYYHALSSLEEYRKEYPDIEITQTDGILYLYNELSNGMRIIFYPGAKVDELAYIPIMAELSQMGYFCAIVDMPFHLAVFGIQGADRVKQDSGQMLSTYIAGHSLGGAMASSYAAEHSEKLEGIILLGAYPATDLSDTSLNMLTVYGSEDQVLNMQAMEDSKKNQPPDAVTEILEGGNHAGFGDYGMQMGDGTASLTQQEQREATANLIHEFIINQK